MCQRSANPISLVTLEPSKEFIRDERVGKVQGSRFAPHPHSRIVEHGYMYRATIYRAKRWKEPREMNYRPHSWVDDRDRAMRITFYLIGGLCIALCMAFLAYLLLG
jgi:hypothetical protein